MWQNGKGLGYLFSLNEHAVYMKTADTDLVRVMPFHCILLEVLSVMCYLLAKCCFLQRSAVTLHRSLPTSNSSLA